MHDFVVALYRPSDMQDTRPTSECDVAETTSATDLAEGGYRSR